MRTLFGKHKRFFFFKGNRGIIKDFSVFRAFWAQHLEAGASTSFICLEVCPPSSDARFILVGG